MPAIAGPPECRRSSALRSGAGALVDLDSLPLSLTRPSFTMNQNDFRRFAQQLQKAAGGGAGGGGGFPRGTPPRGFFAGGGLIVALVAGGLALNASLFNGAY